MPKSSHRDILNPVFLNVAALLLQELDYEICLHISWTEAVHSDSVRRPLIEFINCRGDVVGDLTSVHKLLPIIETAPLDCGNVSLVQTFSIICISRQCSIEHRKRHLMLVLRKALTAL
jgi:hypothetical protein